MVQIGELVKKMNSQFNTFDKFLWRFMGKVKKSDKLVRWIEADKVLGKENIISKLYFFSEYLKVTPS